MASVLIAGCGFVGEATARLMQSAGWDVIGVTHSEDSAAGLSSKGFRAIVCDISNPEMVKVKLGEFEGTEALVDCVSSGGGGAERYRENYLNGARNLLKIVQPKKFLFTSSTSVYAQSDGSWVTEDSPAEPTLETGKILRETEELVLAHKGTVARLAGIYAPERWVLLRKFLEGSAIIEGGGNRWINQIHRDDAATAIAFLIAQATSPGVYNVTDGNPLTQMECYQLLARQFNKPIPASGLLDTKRKRGVTNKRVSNGKLTSLGWTPLFQNIQKVVELLSSTLPAVDSDPDKRVR